MSRFIIYFVLIIVLAAALFCRFHFQFWTHKETNHFKALAQFKGEHVKSHLGRQILVHKTFLPVLEMMNTTAGKLGVTILVTSAFRCPGQRLSDTVVKPATRSNHLAGHAVDFNIIYQWKTYESGDMRRELLPALPLPVQQFIDTLRQTPNLRWGGDFNTQDPVHADSALNRTDPEQWERYHDACFTDWVTAPYLWQKWMDKLFPIKLQPPPKKDITPSMSETATQ